VRILINAANVASAGGWGVLTGLVPAMGEVRGGDELLALVPPGTAARLGGAPPGVCLLEQRRSGPRALWRLLDDFVRLPALARRLRPDVCFSITDLAPSDVGCPHVLLLHNPWVTYRLPRRQVGRSLRDQTIYATYYPARFRRLWPRLAHIVVQTPVMAARLGARFGVPAERVTVIPPGCLLRRGASVPREHPVTPDAPLRLFWPARAYPHKNHDVLAPLCAELARAGLARLVRFFPTIDPASGRRAARLLAALARHADMVTNLGPLATPEVERWFDATDALFLPTLLESYSLTYLEAAARRRPVLTSDRDFARHACGAAGYYFDPEDPADIAARIRALVADVAAGTVRIPEPPALDPEATSWRAVAARTLDVVREAHA
jgi:glycosyltransferase involved in cell wall biosynthesis